jgi:hypothetical protein
MHGDEWMAAAGVWGEHSSGGVAGSVSAKAYRKCRERAAGRGVARAYRPRSAGSVASDTFLFPPRRLLTLM